LLFKNGEKRKAEIEAWDLVIAVAKYGYIALRYITE